MPGIGEFVIGESSIGSAPFDYRPTIMSQYANSQTILLMLSDLSQWIDPTANLDDFFDTVWNVLTAVGFGLDIWGRIVGVGRVYPLNDVTFFGFEEATDTLGFNQGIFWSGNVVNNNYALSDDAYRRLILAKAMSNITDGSTPALNQILLNMFPGRGNCYVVDNADMTMAYKFEFALTPVDLTIVKNSGVLPNPTGVEVDVVHA